MSFQDKAMERGLRGSLAVYSGDCEKGRTFISFCYG